MAKPEFTAQFTKEELQTEEWRQSLHPCYEISNIGRVRRSTPIKGTRIGRLVRPHITNVGYWIVGLYQHSQETKCCIHTLVTEAFIGPRPDGYVVNHKDFNKLNNRVENLEYVTERENIRHFTRTGRQHGQLIPIEQVQEIKRLLISIPKQYGLYAWIGSLFGVSIQTVSNIASGRIWGYLEPIIDPAHLDKKWR